MSSGSSCIQLSASGCNWWNHTLPRITSLYTHIFQAGPDDGIKPNYTGHEKRNDRQAFKTGRLLLHHGSGVTGRFPTALTRNWSSRLRQLMQSSAHTVRTSVRSKRIQHGPVLSR